MLTKEMLALAETEEIKALQAAIDELGTLHGYLRRSAQLESGLSHAEVIKLFNRIHERCVQLNGEYEGLGL